MVTLPPWLVGVVIVYVIALTSIFSYLFMEQVQRKRRRKAGADPVEQAYADNGFAVDVEPAPATDELPPVDERAVNGLLVEIYRAQTRARFKGIYGEDTS